MFTAMRYQDDCLHLIDQRRLPHDEQWIVAQDLATVALAIENMSVRGAPAIAIAAAFALALDARQNSFRTWLDYKSRFLANCDRLLATRPTAVNLAHALRSVRQLAESWPADLTRKDIAEATLGFALALEQADLSTCRAIGQHGASLAAGRKLRILTHCNTGSLATAGYGTALGVLRALHEQTLVEHVYVGETRPYLQGSRLTAFELAAEGIPYSIQTDSAAAYIMRHERVDLVVVGADRIVANGDTANKIGTYSLAIIARYHDVPFYVAAPLSSFDPSIADGMAIPIEMRQVTEITEYAGIAIAPRQAQAINPSFDVTPSALISGFITEQGILRSPYSQAIQAFLEASKMK